MSQKGHPEIILLNMCVEMCNLDTVTAYVQIVLLKAWLQFDP